MPIISNCSTLAVSVLLALAISPPEQVKELEFRLKQLEPPKPITIIQSPEEVAAEGHKPADVKAISRVIQKGTRIPFQSIHNDPGYKRPVYEQHWHSTYGGGRWAYVPTRVEYALHRLFTTYDIGLSNLYDFQQNVGIVFPVFQNKEDLDLYIVAFQTEITDVYTSGNQVVVTGNPKRNGVQVITIKTGDLHPSDAGKTLLIQLATPQGDELDQSYIGYAPPNFWARQIQKYNNKRQNAG